MGDNIGLFMRHEQRLLDLVMSQILDQGVASILSHVLFNIGLHSNKRNQTVKQIEEEKTLHCVMHFKTLMEFQEQAEQNFPFLYTMTTVNRTEEMNFYQSR